MVIPLFPRSNYRGFFTTGESYCPMYTLCSDAGILYYCIGGSIGSSIICASRLLPLSLVPALQWNALVADSSLYHVIAASKWNFNVSAEFLCPFQLVSFPRFQLSLAMYFLIDRRRKPEVCKQIYMEWKTIVLYEWK